MPRRDDLESILMIGSGPIVIGQACEFDYSGTRACRVLREEGFRLILVNSNPATIMTDPDSPTPPTWNHWRRTSWRRSWKRRGRTPFWPLWAARRAEPGPGASDAGALADRGIQLIGATAEAINTAEDRGCSSGRWRRSGSTCRIPALPKTWPRPWPWPGARASLRHPSLLHLGGKGSGVAVAGMILIVGGPRPGRQPLTEILIEKSIAAWKEFELEVMRDRDDNS